MPSSAYNQAYQRTMKLAGLQSDTPDMDYIAPGMAAGAAAGARLGERMAKDTRTKIFGWGVPGTETVDPDTAHLLGQLVGSLSGGYAKHQDYLRNQNPYAGYRR